MNHYSKRHIDEITQKKIENHVGSDKFKPWLYFKTKKDIFQAAILWKELYKGKDEDIPAIIIKIDSKIKKLRNSERGFKDNRCLFNWRKINNFFKGCQNMTVLQKIKKYNQEYNTTLTYKQYKTLKAYAMRAGYGVKKLENNDFDKIRSSEYGIQLEDKIKLAAENVRKDGKIKWDHLFTYIIRYGISEKFDNEISQILQQTPGDSLKLKLRHLRKNGGWIFERRFKRYVSKFVEL